MPDVICTSHRTLMHYQLDETEDGFALFQTPAEPDEDLPVETVIINRDMWVDMGRPEVITVTVEPGDLLNEEPVHEAVTHENPKSTWFEVKLL